jgi:predicted transcriptional regulator
MKSLTKAEEQIMLILWQLEQGFLKDILPLHPEPQPHSNTVATVLKVLVDKGFVTTELHGRNNLYIPAITKEAYGKKTVNQVIKGYFENSPSKLLSHFVNEKKISTEELEQLLSQIKSSKKNSK